MDKQVIIISEDVINNVVKPMSLFLNDVEAGSVFTHVSMKGNEYKIDKKDGKEQYPVFKFSSSKGGTFKFTTFDLRNFLNNEVSFNDYFVPQIGKKCLLQPDFVVNSCEPLLVDNQKVYPFFCYTGYEAYLTAKEELPIGQYPTEAMIDTLKATDIKPSAVDKYYRKVDIDKPIFYYADTK
jgi:hypothetical protein